jgi:hypothetical protein
MFVAGAATLPGIFIGAFLLNVWVGYTTAHHADAAGIAAAAGIALASSVQAAVGGSALRSLIGYPRRWTRRVIFCFSSSYRRSSA